MAQKTVKEVVQNVFTGEVSIEYSDETTKSYNIDENPVAKYDGSDIVFEVFGEEVNVAAVAAQAVVDAQNIAAISGTYTEGEILTVALPTGWTGTYQWTRDGAEIVGETNDTYTLAALDVGTVVTCKVSALVFAPVGDTVVAA